CDPATDAGTAAGTAAREPATNETGRRSAAARAAEPAVDLRNPLQTSVFNVSCRSRALAAAKHSGSFTRSLAHNLNCVWDGPPRGEVMRLSRFAYAVPLFVIACEPAHVGDYAERVEDLTVCASGSTVEGIDVSIYQGTINWSQVAAAGKKFAV